RIVPATSLRARDLLKSFSFVPLFIEELGWDRHKGTLQVTTGSRSFELNVIAHKRGMVAYHCATGEGDFPDYSPRRQKGRHVAMTTREHIIVFTDSPKTSQIWQWVKREPGRPVACREHHFHKSQSGNALFQ